MTARYANVIPLSFNTFAGLVMYYTIAGVNLVFLLLLTGTFLVYDLVFNLLLCSDEVFCYTS